MTTPESKEKCCPKCNGYRSAEYPDRPECINPACPQCHQRPESDWREKFDKGDFRPPLDFVFEGQEYLDALETFIARQRDSEYHRGLAEGAGQERELVVHRLDSILAAYSNDRPVPPTVLRQFQDSLTTPPHNESV